MTLHARRSWREGGHGSVAILYDWEASRLDALFDVYYLNASSLQLKCAPAALSACLLHVSPDAHMPLLSIACA